MQVDAARHASGSGDALTDREHEVLHLLERRLSNKEIASILRITERTVKFHVGNILDKLNLRSRQQVFAA
jgi:DNA-binding CsgD family transcriptional regulator